MERWLGVVLQPLLQQVASRRSDAGVEDDPVFRGAGAGDFAAIHFRRVNLFHLSARVIDRSGWIHPSGLPEAPAKLIVGAFNPPPSLSPTVDRVRCEDTGCSVYLDGKRIANDVPLAVFRFFRVIARAQPDFISYKKIAERAPGLHGKHSTRDLMDKLPKELRTLVVSGKLGYALKLPKPK